MKKKLLQYFGFTLIAIGLFVSASAQDWESISTPVNDNLILYDMSFPAGQDDFGFTGGSNVTYNGKGKVLKTEDLGETWEVVWESDENGTGVMSLYFFDTMTGFAGTMGGNLMKTTDGGVNWTSTDIDDSENQGEIKDINFYDANNGALATSWNGIYITSDGGETWTVASTNYVGAHDLCYGDANNLFACGGSQNIYKSTDGGDTWSFSFQGANGAMQWVNLGVDFVDANNGAVTSEEGDIFITQDGGDTWESSNVTGQFGLMNGLKMISASNIYVCATPGEVFQSIDGGESWDSETYDFNPSYYKILFTNNGTGFVCGSGSTGGTILKKEVVNVGLNEAIEIEVSAYPNPTSDQINIEFPFDANENLSVVIINSLGKIVMRETMNASEGINRVTLDLNNVSEGHYVISIRNENSILGVRKMQVIK